MTIFEAMNLIFREVQIIKHLNYHEMKKNIDVDFNDNIINPKLENIIENYKIYDDNNELEKCFLYFDNTDKRRKLMKDENNYYNYIPVINKNSNNNKFAQNENEMLYHYLFYKTLLCKYCDLSDENNNENLLCPYSHNILKDFRIIYNYKDEKTIKFMLLLLNSKLFQFKNYLNCIPMSLSSSFNIDTFKVHKCLNNEKEKCPNNYHLCPYYHINAKKNRDGQRRPLPLFRYSGKFGEKCFREGKYYPDECEFGIFCPFVHNKNEYNYHDTHFRKRFECEREKKDGNCKYYETCYGIHSEDIKKEENIKKQKNKIENMLNIIKCRKCQEITKKGNLYFFIKCKHFICGNCFQKINEEIKNDKNSLKCPFCDCVLKSQEIFIF